MTDRILKFSLALVDGRWVEDAVFHIGGDGVIAAVDAESTLPDAVDETVRGIAIPGMVNVHSHAFQRALAGLAEYQTSETDSFWTWRKLMYEFVEQTTPEVMHAVAAGLYRELVRHGYTWVGEFHYVHTGPGGVLYDDPCCMSDALIAAAQDAGIGICLLPVLYQRGGFRDEPLDGAQRRFRLSDDQFANLVSSLRARWADAANVGVGIAFHSLRAVAVGSIDTALSALRHRDDCPVHIHVGEQQAEVDECISVTGRRPVEYLMSEVQLDPRWCLIHATHVSAHELSNMIDAQVVAGLCPTTEANLGDGVFPAAEFLSAGGRFAVGSDAHVSVSPRSELRLLEYGQRLTQQRRAILGTADRSTGMRLYEDAATGGAQAIGVNTGALRPGSRADLVVLDADHPTIGNATGDRIADKFIFCDAGNPVQRVMVGGRWVV